MFDMNFNQRGSAFNNKDVNIYNLTRTTPEPYWSTNHLLMRIWADTKEDLAFKTGNPKKAKNWTEIEGKTEFIYDDIIITSLPGKNGLLKLNKTDEIKDLNLSVNLKGNSIGNQFIMLRCDQSQSSYIEVRLLENNLTINEKANNEVKTLYEVELNTNKQIHNLELTLLESSLSLKVDQEDIINDLKVTITTEGFIYLGSAANITNINLNSQEIDEIYDGVFNKLVITDNNETIISTKLKGMELFTYKIKKAWEGVSNWFIEVL